MKTVLEISPVLLNSSRSTSLNLKAACKEDQEFHYLTPFTWYKFLIREKGDDTILTEIGPIRTWPLGNLNCNLPHFFYF